jgi:hypothetical protein
MEEEGGGGEKRWWRRQDDGVILDLGKDNFAVGTALVDS